MYPNAHVTIIIGFILLKVDPSAKCSDFTAHSHLFTLIIISMKAPKPITAKREKIAKNEKRIEARRNTEMTQRKHNPDTMIIRILSLLSLAYSSPPQLLLFLKN